MCGLFGIAALNGNEIPPAMIVRAKLALATLAHRGPDGEGFLVHGRALLGHRRLSIIDLSPAGSQPMQSDDGDIAIAVNGEIYNFKTLRERLGAGQFRSSCDSEVVLHGYRAWGIDRLCDEIDGIFAAIVSDRKTGKLYFIRDRPGAKPLYYGRIGNTLVWASELKAIRAFADGDGGLQADPTALFDFLTYRYIPAPKSIYRNIVKLPAATIAEIDLASGQIIERRYWRAEPGDDREVDTDDAAEELRALVKESVTEQLVSDVPLGFFLSGGIDSSVLTAVGAKAQPNCMTFSIGFDVPEHDESSFARIVADTFATTHFRHQVNENDAGDLMARMRDWYDEPFADTSALPTYFVSALAHERATVALSGDGADELFGGYSWYLRYWKYLRVQGPLSGTSIGLDVPFTRYPRSLPRKLMNRIALWAQLDPIRLYVSLMPNLLASERASFRRALEIPDDYDDMWSARRYWRPELSPLKRLQFHDFHTFLPDDILTKVDRVSMAQSLEVRVPFLSRKLIEFAFRMPASFLMLGRELKGGLKYAYRNTLPTQILARKKKGFSVPIEAWKRTVLPDTGTFQERVARHFLAEGKRWA